MNTPPGKIIDSTDPTPAPRLRLHPWIRRFVVTFLLVFGCEFIVMMTIPFLDLAEGITIAIIDSALLSLLVIPGMLALGLLRYDQANTNPDEKNRQTTRRESNFWGRLFCLRNQYIAILVTLAVGPLLWLGWSLKREISQNLHQDAVSAGKSVLDVISKDLQHDLNTLSNEALNISLYPPISGLLRSWNAGGIDPLDGSTEELWRQRLESLLSAHMTSHRGTEQIRFLDEDGWERIRVNIENGQPQVSSVSELQDKSDRCYFKDAITLKEGQFYISSLDLNMENGILEVPHTPMLRVSTPVWMEGRPRGVIVINFSPEPLFARLQAGNQGSIILADHQGTYLHHPDVSKRWANQLGGDANLFSDWPTLARRTDHDERGQAIKDELAFIWVHFSFDPNDPEKCWLLGMEWDETMLFSAKRRLHEAVVTASIGVGVIALIAAFIMAAYWGRPITRLAHAANRLGEGDFAVRVPATRHDELGDMGRAFNHMMTLLQERQEALTVALNTAETATRSKSDFLANMSHEIRTPMTAILGFTETMLDPNLSDSEMLNAIYTIRRNGEHLLQIINDILDISKIEAGKLDIERIHCSIVQVASEVISLMQVRADAKNLNYYCEFLRTIPETIESDPTRLKQILVNLIGNAIKFTETGGVRLIISFVDDGPESYLQFDVIDTGIGMTDEQVDGLFQAFTQADTSTTRKFGGTGLGLVISKRLTELLGGAITVQSTPGEGSLFRMRLPTGPLEGVRMLEEPTVAIIIKPELAPATNQDVDKLDCRILFAEDGPDNQRLVGFILRKAGAEVTIVENGKLALEAALEARDEGHPFAVILMDMQMPVMDGYEATGMLRQKGYTGPIVALTAHAMASDRQKCLDAGCDEYQTKPIDRQSLIACVNRYATTKTASRVRS